MSESELAQAVLVLTLKDGDTLIVKMPERCSKREAERVKEQVEPLLPSGVKCLVSIGYEFEVLRPA
jgi:hypothetical protein